MQKDSSISKVIFWLMVASLPGAGGCVIETQVSEFQPSFGFSYLLARGSMPPSLQNDSVIAFVSYNGCDGNHRFHLASSFTGSGRADLWFVKDTPDQACDASIVQRLAAKLPQWVLMRPVIGFQSPSNSPWMLRNSPIVRRDVIVVDDPAQLRTSPDPVDLRRAAIHGDLLTVQVGYAGGCREHQFQLYALRDLSKALQPEVDLYLSHDGMGDMCERALEADCTFDLGNLRMAIRPAMGRWGTVLLRVHPPHDRIATPIPPVVYNF